MQDQKVIDMAQRVISARAAEEEAINRYMICDTAMMKWQRETRPRDGSDLTEWKADWAKQQQTLGYRATLAAADAASDHVTKLLDKLSKMEAQTLAGTAAKAKAALLVDRVLSEASDAVAKSIMKDVCRVAGESHG